MKFGSLKKTNHTKKIEEKIRLDRFLWATRNFKTRSLSTDACKRNWIQVNNTFAKASREVRIGDKIKVKKPSHLKSFEIIKLLNSRVGAKLVEDYIRDLTPEAEYEKEKKFRKNKILFPSSKGRPSKKQRRDLDEFLTQSEDS